MIPVTLQPEPADFDDKVRKKGHAWLRAQSIALNAAPPKAADLPAYWSHSNKQLWDAYSGTCAYLAIYFEWITGASSTDHFVAKSQHAGDAYEWDNYRLSCLGANRNKNKFDDVLDPIGLATDTFVLNLASGQISPNPSLEATQKQLARKAIERLKLDSPEHRKVRTDRFSVYVRIKSSALPDMLPANTLRLLQENLRKEAPFVWYEAQRQGLL